MVRFSERQNNTNEQVLGYLTAALEITNEIDPPRELREVCFTKAVDLLASKQIVMEQPQQVGMPLGLGNLRS
jgi:hypothetical protein